MANKSEQFYSIQKNEIIMHVYVQPRASKNEISCIYNGRLKIRLQTPPVDGKANKALCNFIAELFCVPQSQVILIKGASGRNKTIKIFSPKCIPACINKDNS